MVFKSHEAVFAQILLFRHPVLPKNSKKNLSHLFLCDTNVCSTTMYRSHNDGGRSIPPSHSKNKERRGRNWNLLLCLVRSTSQREDNGNNNLLPAPPPPFPLNKPPQCVIRSTCFSFPGTAEEEEFLFLSDLIYGLSLSLLPSTAAAALSLSLPCDMNGQFRPQGRKRRRQQWTWKGRENDVSLVQNFPRS